MTVPRKLSLKKYGDSYLLHNYAIKATDSLIEETKPKEIAIEANDEWEEVYENLNQTEILFNTKFKDFALTLSNKQEETVSIGFDSVSNLILFDRTKSGLVDFQLDFGNKLHYMSIDKLPEIVYEVRILIDNSSLELFVNGGQYVMTEQLFPTENYTSLKIENDTDSSIDFTDFKVAKISSIWE
jgi:fructan beta-fructosidase